MTLFFIPYDQATSYGSESESFLEYDKDNDLIWLCTMYHNVVGKARLAAVGRENLRVFLDQIEASR